MAVRNSPKAAAWLCEIEVVRRDGTLTQFHVAVAVRNSPKAAAWLCEIEVVRRDRTTAQHPNNDKVVRTRENAALIKWQCALCVTLVTPNDTAWLVLSVSQLRHGGQARA